MYKGKNETKKEKGMEPQPAREKELAAAAAAAAAVIEGMSDPVVVTNLDGTILQINKASEIYGFKKEELVGKMPIELVAKRDVSKVVEALKECVEKGFVRNIEITSLRKDGGEVHSLLNMTLMKDVSGEPTGLITVLRDITELKRAEEEHVKVGKAAAAARTVTEIIKAMPDAVYVLDLDGKVLSCNPAMMSMFGRKAEDVIGKSVAEQPGIRSEDIERSMEALKEFLETGRAKPLEMVVCAKDGRGIPISIVYSAIKDEKGNLKNLVCMVRDITELKRAEEERLSVVRERAAIVDAMGDGLIVTDLDGNIISINRAMEELLIKRGISINVKKIIGRSALDLPHIRPEDVEKYVALMRDVIEKGKAGPLEVRGATGGWDSITASLLKDAEGNPTVLFAVVRDITELKRAEEERLAVFKRAADTMDAMGDALYLLDMDGKIVFVNSAAEKMGGHDIKKSELAGKDAADLISKFIKSEDLEKIMGTLGPALEGKVPTPQTFTMLSKDGREIPVISVASFIKDAEGKPINMVVTLRDITELKRAEEERLTASRSIEETMESMIDCVAVVDIDGRVIQINKVVETMFGYKKDEVIGKIPAEFLIEEDIPRFMEELKQTLKTGFLRNFECRVVTKDGRKLPTSVNITLLKDTEGNPKSMVAVLRDITELKKLINGLEDARATLEDRVKERTAELEASKRELKDKLEDLERFAKVAVGRELKMRDMEEEIAKLKEELKRKELKL